METDYCVLCQDGHKMTQLCVASHALCKECGGKGHVRKDCPTLFAVAAVTRCDESNVEDGKIRSLNIGQRKAVKINYYSDANEMVRIIKDCNNIISRGTKPEATEHEQQNSDRLSKSSKPLPEQELTENVHGLTSLKETAAVIIVNSNIPSGAIIDLSEEVGDSNDNVIDLSDDGEVKSDKKDDSDKIRMSYKVDLLVHISEDEEVILDDDFEKVVMNHKSNSSMSTLEGYSKTSRHKKSAGLKAGNYNIVCVHIEIFRASSKSSSSKLTQIGCSVMGSESCLFFEAIRPGGIEKYLDRYKLGGDLLQALHMTREDDGTFLFRSRFEAIKETEKIVCTEEKKALENLLEFLQNYPKCILVGFDEDTISILVKKLKSVDREKFDIVNGFTYWKRVLKYLDVEGYKNIDLEEYYTSLVGHDLPGFNTATDIAAVLMKSVMEVTNKEKGGKKSMGSDFYKLCKKIESIGRPKKIDCVSTKSGLENVEVYSSFRPSVSATLSAEKLEQIVVSSESDSEPEETGICQSDQAGFKNNFGSETTLDGIKNIDISNKASTMDERMEPITINVEKVSGPYQLASKSTIHQISKSTAKRLLSKKGVWQYGKSTPKEGTVMCPSRNCKVRVRYSRIHLHINKKHPNEKKKSHLCPRCGAAVMAAAVNAHMIQPCPTSSMKVILKPSKAPKARTSVSSSAPTTARVSSLALITAPITRAKARVSSPARGSSAAPIIVIDDIAIPPASLPPASLPPASIPPASIPPTSIPPTSYQTLSAQRTFLDSYLSREFAPYPYPCASLNCLWMFKNFKEALMSAGHLQVMQVMSPAEFVRGVKEFAETRWNINVFQPGTAEGEESVLRRMTSSQLVFKGFRHK